MADRTGGRFFLSDKTDLKSALLDIASELNHLYSIAFYPTDVPQKTKRRKLKVKVNRPDLAVRSRRYYTSEPAKRDK